MTLGVAGLVGAGVDTAIGGANGVGDTVRRGAYGLRESLESKPDCKLGLERCLLLLCIERCLLIGV